MSFIHTPSAGFDIHWCNDLAQAQPIADLFLRHLTPHYMAHTDLQCPRAVAPGEWRADLPAIVHAEVRHALAQNPARATALIATAHSDGVLAGLAFVAIDEAREAARPFATLDDIVVDTPFRGTGLGTRLFDWVCAELAQRGTARLFLESGIGNTGAQRFFEARGCTPVSVTMLKELAR